MIEKNVILIETIDSLGTGFMYPCKYRDEPNAFIIISNMHVISSYITLRNAIDDIDIKSHIKFTLYDNLGDIVKKEDIKLLKSFIPEHINFFEPSEDIVAFLVVLRESICIDLCTDLCMDVLENRSPMFVEGYPGVLFNEEINQRIRLKGMEKTLFPINNKIGAYQITDDYHWYGDMEDKQLLQGLSGSPVFVHKDNKEMIMGINQSISCISVNQNPFKIIYYIRMNHILQFLTDNDCIIYRKIAPTTYCLEWIYKEDIQLDNNLTLLLLGGSGAGKSSVARDFAYHGKYFNSTNDGQTTRTDVIYKYTLKQEKPMAKITFLGQVEFAKRMLEHAGTYPARLYFKQVFDLYEETIQNDKSFLNKLYHIIELFKELPDKNKTFTDILVRIHFALQDELSNTELLDLYDDMLDKLVGVYCYPIIRYIIDEEWLKHYLKNPNKITEFDNSTSNLSNIIEKEAKIYEQNNSKSRFDQFVKKIMDFIKDRKELFENEKENFVSIYNRLDEEDFKKQYINVIKRNVGFFDAKEYAFIADDIFEFEVENNHVYKKEERSLNDKNRKRDICFYSRLEEIYKNWDKKLICIITDYIKNKYEFEINNHKLEISFSKMNKHKQDLLTKCLQVTSEGSLTGIIDKVEIEDKVCNNYSFIFHELGIKELKMIDTYGLDHIASMTKKDIVRRLLDFNDKYMDNISDKSNRTAILFVKKLDAGKPDELRYILPSVKKSIPQCPIYCLFSGIDIFYRSEVEISSIDWTVKSERNPKSINYLLECENNYSEALGCDESQYHVLVNNMIPYCGKMGLVNQHFYLVKNNYFYIRRMLASIIMLEYHSMEFVELNETQENNLKKVVENSMRELFKNATLKSYNYRWNTVEANKNRIKEGKMGHCGIYRHCFYQLFHDAYVYIMNEFVENELKVFDLYNESLYKSMLSVEKKFFGSNDGLYDSDMEEEKKSDFRKILDRMYEQGCKSGIYKHNYMAKGCLEEIDEDRYAFFDDAFDFAKGLEVEILFCKGNNQKNGSVLSLLTEEYMELLLEEIEHNNKTKAYNLTNLSEDYIIVINAMKKDFEKKYGEKSLKNFNKFMIYFFKKMNEEK